GDAPGTAVAADRNPAHPRRPDKFSIAVILSSEAEKAGGVGRELLQISYSAPPPKPRRRFFFDAGGRRLG
ncbi:hypothetical protein, partial [Paracoccus limosus]|uniref:hypothetical protein n=1 Tax=Paracoccus limosus TaxID=913252 RepID=UPI001B875BC1